MADKPFGLIRPLQPQMGSELERTHRQAKLGGSHFDPGEGGPAFVAEMGNGEFHGLNAGGGRQRSEPAVRKKHSTRFIEPDAPALERSKQFRLAHAAYADRPGNHRAVRVDGSGSPFLIRRHAT
jgi:hypothetical protein